MQFALMVEGQEGITYRRMLELARAAEAAGFDAFVRSDHWLSLEGAWDRPATDAWTTLAGLARETGRIRLGTLVSPITFRLPVAIAKIVATVDEMSDGRVELGLGAGWYDPEHERLGIPYPARAERFARLEEQLQIIRGLWTRPELTFEGRFYRLRQAVCEPRPLQRPHPPIVVGGYGRAGIVCLAATYAYELNLDTPTPDACQRVFGALDEACRAAGRDPEELRRSAMLLWTPELAGAAPAAQREHLARYAAAGVQRIVLNVDPERTGAGAVERLGSEVVAPLR